MSKVLIVGGGAAGMAAAIASAGLGHEVHLYEKNEKLGKKLFITGKGRCNVTNACDMDTFQKQVVTNSRFLYSSFAGFTNQDMMALLERNGCPLKVERGGRVFPVSDHSSDVITALARQMREYGVRIHLNSQVKGLWVEAGQCRGIFLKSGSPISGDAVIVATGGLSYETTGSTGDGLGFAKDTGHQVTECRPALVSLNGKEADVKALQGLSLKNIGIRILDGKKELYQDFGEMLFTHFGVSGPVILSGSSFVAEALSKRSLTLLIDLKPALSREQLDQRFLRDFEEASKKQFKNALGHLYPAKLIPVIIARSGIDPEKPVHEVTREERRQLLEVTKEFSVTLTGLRSFKEAIITQGGVSVKDIVPSTMESKKISGLYFAGEVLDLDAVTGGFNLQIAWSTGWAAGSSIPWA